MESLTINTVGISTDSGLKLASGINNIIEGAYIQPVKKISLFKKGNPSLMLDFNRSHITQYKKMINIWQGELNNFMSESKSKGINDMIKKLEFKTKLADNMIALREQAKGFKHSRVSKNTIINLAKNNNVKIADVIKEAYRRALVQNPMILKLKKLIVLQAFDGNENLANQELANHDSEYLLEAVNLAKDIPEIQNELDRLKKEYDILKDELKKVDLDKIKAQAVVGQLPVKLEITNDAHEANKQASLINKEIPSIDVITKKNEIMSNVKKFKKPALIVGGIYLAMQMLG